MSEQLRLFDNPKQHYTGEQLALIGQSKTEHANSEAISAIGAAFLEHLRARAPEPGSMDTLRDSGFQLPAMTSNNVVGAAISRLAGAGLIRTVGVTRSTHPESHGGKLYQWRLAVREETPDV